MGPIHDALELPMCSCNLGDILEQCALCKGMSRLTTHDMWPRQTGLLVRGKGMDCDVDPLDCKIGSVVILINLDGAKTIIERFKGQDWDQVDLVEPLDVRTFPGLSGVEIPRVGVPRVCLGGNSGHIGSVRFLKRFDFIFTQLCNGQEET